MKNQRWSFKVKAMASTAMAFLLALILLTFGVGIHSAHAGTIAQSPLFISLAGVNPNLMLILDDSGSMMFEIMPDDYTYSATYTYACPTQRQPDRMCTESLGQIGTVYMFPRVDGVYNNGVSNDYTNLVPNQPSATNPYGAIMRSSAWNKLYYNPAITYTPWKEYNGTSYPNADPKCALHNPKRSGTTSDYCLDLTGNLGNSSVTTYWVSCTSPTGQCTATQTAPTNFPTATYCIYNGGTGSNPEWNFANYTCNSISPTNTVEMQNFANWYTYYRSRVLAVRGGVGKAFVNQSPDLRVGFGVINQGSSTIDGVSTSVIVKGVRPFTGTDRQDIYTKLYTRNVPEIGRAHV